MRLWSVGASAKIWSSGLIRSWISTADTANRGLLDLRNAGLLDVEERIKTAPLASE